VFENGKCCVEGMCCVVYEKGTIQCDGMEEREKGPPGG